MNKDKWHEQAKDYFKNIEELIRNPEKHKETFPSETELINVGFRVPKVFDECLTIYCRFHGMTKTEFYKKVAIEGFFAAIKSDEKDEGCGEWSMAYDEIDVIVSNFIQKQRNKAYDEAFKNGGGGDTE